MTMTLHYIPNKEKQIELYNQLLNNKSYMKMFDVLLHMTQDIALHLEAFADTLSEKHKTDSLLDLNYNIVGFQSLVMEHILSECNLYLNEVQIFNYKNNITNETPASTIYALKVEQSFPLEAEQLAWREPFMKLLIDFMYNGSLTPAEITRKIVFWNELPETVPLSPQATGFYYGRPYFSLEEIEN